MSPTSRTLELDLRDAVSDRQLMEDVDTGDLEAFAELYDRYCHRAYHLALSICRDDGRAQDAVQEAFLSVWRRPRSYQPHRGTVAAWLLTVVRYRAIDLARGNARHESGRSSGDQLETHTDLQDVTEAAIRRDDARSLRACLALLPGNQQEVIVLAFYGQLSHAEIATRLQLPPGTVKGRMRLGLQKLRANLEQAAA